MVNSGNTSAVYRYAYSELKVKLVWYLSLLHLVMLHQILLLKLSYLLNIFSSIFPTDNNTIPPGPQQLPILSIDPVFTIAKVKTLMHKLDPQSARGPNGVPPIFLKSCKHSLSPSFAHLFSLFYTHSYLPPSWRLAYITPIFMNGDPACVSNYRPISLT